MKNEKNLCLNCNSKLRGRCCFHSWLIEGYNIILDNQHCKFLDTKTMSCKEYKNRKKIYPECATIDEAIGKAGLPMGCLYLKDKMHLEPHPKVNVKDVAKHLSMNGLMFYNFLNNISDFESFRKLYGKGIKKQSN